MNSYSPTNQTINISPYQQNIDIIKNFFKKPIVLVSAILQAIVLVLLLITFFVSSGINSSTLSNIGAPTAAVQSLNVFSLAISIIGCIPSVLVIVCWFLIYFQSKNSNPAVKPSVPFKILWVLSIICTAAFGGLALILLAVFGIAFGILGTAANYSYQTSYYGQSYGYSSEAASLLGPLFAVIMVILVIVIAINLFFMINEIRYYQSVKNSLQTIYLKNNGAMIYGVIQIIASAFLCLFFVIYSLIIAALIIGASSYSSNAIPSSVIATLVCVIVTLGISAVSGLINGIIAVKYSSYIKSIRMGTNQSFNANQPYSNPVIPQGDFYAGNYQQNVSSNEPLNNPYENPYSNPQQINPQEPQPPVSENPYIPPVQQAYQPTQEKPQQPVQENVTDEVPVNSNVCPNCGSPVFRSDMFCNNCGTKLK